MTLRTQIFVLLWFFHLFNNVICLRLIDIQLPSIAIFGKSAQLNCTYELEQDQLYSIKWYHNDNEFYRYLPNDNPPEQFYHTKGLYVDLEKSSKSLVYLRKVDLRTDGLFRVEISAEAPSFQTVRKEKYLNVYYFPREAPLVKLKNKTNDLRINDVLDVTCQTGPAKPATKLQFFINDIPISQAYANLTETVSPVMLDDTDDEENEHRANLVDSLSNEFNSIDYQNSLNNNNNDINQSTNLVLFNTTLRLRIRLRQALLKTKKTLNLRCASYVTHFFTKSSEHVFTVLNEDAHLNELARQQAKFNLKKNNLFKNLNRKTFGPFIDNTRSNYAIGDLINVTCFTGNSKPPAFLQWFIDEREAPTEYLRVYKPIETKDGLRSLLGLEFRLTEEFLINQQQQQLMTSTIQPFSSDQQTLTTSELSSRSQQDLNSITASTTNDELNQTIKLINKKHEIKLKCVAQLSRIVHVRSRQFSLGNRSKLLDDQTNLAYLNQLNHCLFKCYAILFFYCFIINFVIL